MISSHRLLSLPESSLVVTDRVHLLMRPLISLLSLLNSEQSSRNWPPLLLTQKRDSFWRNFMGQTGLNVRELTASISIKDFPSRNTVSSTWTGTSVLSCAFSKDVQQQLLAVLLQKSLRITCLTIMVLTGQMVWSFQKSQLSQRQTKNILRRSSAHYARKSSLGNTI